MRAVGIAIRKLLKWSRLEKQQTAQGEERSSRRILMSRDVFSKELSVAHESTIPHLCTPVIQHTGHSKCALVRLMPGHNLCAKRQLYADVG